MGWGCWLTAGGEGAVVVGVRPWLGKGLTAFGMVLRGVLRMV